ncbi:hypothetical protein C7974DRAFT_444495 [Boeremia exigua]|uniref:uncharacterized protein n=1 Tax=Boeremia exigua TaxID=749465 RepID=UPI001E8E8981|nr:uncharacterized protein C7974DRAFT_444495 [Boeremia exigua]KAH6613023.1 hypothetical protein C7974DRAFT_444495 [Boeremia exigua]
MSILVHKMLEKLYEFPDRVLQPDEDRDQFLVPWGFTIYRTFYGPGSDDQWSKLLQTITTGTKYRLSIMDGGEDTVVTTKLLELLHLDARSDPTLLDGLTLEDVRKVYINGTGGQPMNVANDPWRVFFLADAQVLQDPELGLLKVVAAEYDPDAGYRHPQKFFGWITMPSATVVDLWDELDTYYLWQIVNFTTGGPGVYWDVDRIY